MISVAADATLVVIGNPQLPIQQLTKDQLAALYLGKPVSLKSRVTPYSQSNTSNISQQFYQQIVGWNSDQVSSYWSSQIFSGNSQEPSAVNDDQDAIQTVEQDPTAIAYVDSDSLQNVGNQVKVVYGDYKIPVPQIHKVNTPPPPQNPNQLYSSSETNGYMTALSSDPSTALADSSSPTSDPDAGLAQQLTEINNSNDGDQSQNIWDLLSSHMGMQSEYNKPEVQHWIIWFQEHPRVLSTMIDNAVPYLYYVYQQTQHRNIPAEFALLPMIESGYIPRAVSSKGAVGLWQLMPDTASSMGMVMDWWYDSRRDVLTSTNAGLNFLNYLYHMSKAWSLAAAAYNEGPGALQAEIHHNNAIGKPADYWDLDMSTQTRDYVPKLLALAQIISNPSQYGVSLPYVPDRPFFGSVTLTSQMDLQDISQLSGISIPIIRALNPGLQRWATPPSGNFTLLLPVMSVNTFETNLQPMIGKQHEAWKYYQVQSGDTLASIAKQFNTNENQLAEVNFLHAPVVNRGDAILVPVENGATYTKLAGVTGSVAMQASQQEALSNALTRAAQSQTKALPAEVTGEPIQASDDLKSLVSKLYGSD